MDICSGEGKNEARLAQMGVSNRLDFSQVKAILSFELTLPTSQPRAQASSRERELLSSVRDRLSVALAALEEAIDEASLGVCSSPVDVSGFLLSHARWHLRACASIAPFAQTISRKL